MGGNTRSARCALSVPYASAFSSPASARSAVLALGAWLERDELSLPTSGLHAPRTGLAVTWCSQGGGTAPSRPRACAAWGSSRSSEHLLRLRRGIEGIPISGQRTARPPHPMALRRRRCGRPRASRSPHARQCQPRTGRHDIGSGWTTR